MVSLRKTELSDLEYLFKFQLDEVSNHQAAFTSKEYADKSAFIAKHTKLLNDPSVNNQTILFNENIVGSIAKFVMFGENEITYWIDRTYWSKGIATAALRQFIELEKVRPLFGRVAFDNYGSQKILEKCGFVKIGSDVGFANARQKEIEEFIFILS